MGHVRDLQHWRPSCNVPCSRLQPCRVIGPAVRSVQQLNWPGAARAHQRWVKLTELRVHMSRQVALPGRMATADDLLRKHAHHGTSSGLEPMPHAAAGCGPLYRGLVSVFSLSS